MTYTHGPEPPAPDTVVGAAPVSDAERLLSLDILRGVGVLGILIMNIQMFAMPEAAYFNPTVYGDLTGINFFVWLGSHLFAELKFMSIFSMLFGAGIVLLCSHVESQGGDPSRVFFRRTGWLMLFGLAHWIFLWVGDILFCYSLSALLAYLFRRVRPGWLLVWALVLLATGTGIYLLAQISMPYWPPEVAEGNGAYWNPGEEQIQKMLDAYRGGWLSQTPARLLSGVMFQIFGYLFFGLWRTLGLMLVGMALFKWGVLSGERSTTFYGVTALIGLAVGIPIVGYGAAQHIEHNWSQSHSMFGGTLFNYWGSICMALAYCSIIVMICKNKWLSGFQRLLAPVGQMAFTCYIMQTVICTTIFFGHGFGLYGFVPRWGQILMVFVVWGGLILFCRLWKARYRFGPLEWLWRSLTYQCKQPMRRTGNQVMHQPSAV